MNAGNGEWHFPFEVRGWLTFDEGEKLAELARGKRVLEIGAYAGKSAICLAQTAQSLDLIDPLDGRATPAPCDLSDELVANLKRYGKGARIFAGTTEECAPGLPSGSYDLIFIDGDHSAAALRVDVEHALRLLAPGGLLAFHDYQSPPHPDVTAAVGELLAAGAELVETVDLLAVVRPRQGARREKPVVALSMSRRGARGSFGAAEGFYLAPTHGACEVLRLWTCNSILDHTFNRLWAGALNLRKNGATHWLLQHDDVCPAHGWLDVLLAEMFRTGADILSAVVPIKTDEGLTSTALETADVWTPRRLTMTEIHALPETFGDEEAGGELLLNSGLMLVDLRRPWVDTPEPLVFQTLNRLVSDDKGDWQAQVRSEDWEFSRAARARGAKLLVTRKVSLVHDGERAYPNDRPWGAWETDRVHVPRGEALAAAEA